MRFHVSGAAAVAVTAKIGNIELGMPPDSSCAGRCGSGAELFYRTMERFMPLPRSLRSGKWAWCAFPPRVPKTWPSGIKAENRTQNVAHVHAIYRMPHRTAFAAAAVENRRTVHMDAKPGDCGLESRFGAVTISPQPHSLPLLFVSGRWTKCLVLQGETKNRCRGC